MGIRGLTTFIENRSHLYMEKYELHDTKLVIDGNSIACQLYKYHASSHDCFGGDYDKFGKVINDFFDLIIQCNIIPYVVIDGGYESRKVSTIISRMRQKIKAANQLNPVTETSISVFPMFLMKTFEDIVAKRGISKVRCDFEGDTETANIARVLNCPVLSYDSDYFIFDAQYIPFQDFEMVVRTSKHANQKAYNFINCKVYKIEKFLKSFEGLQKSSLPILAVLLGNDYIKRGVFTMFYQNLKVQHCHGHQSEQQKRIKSLLVWLQNETIESALKKVLNRYKKARRKNILDKINNAIKGYNSKDSKYLPYLEEAFVNSKIETDVLSINFVDDDEASSGEEILEVNDVSSDEEVQFTENDDSDQDIPSKFLEKFRRCIYPPSFMDILVQNKYYCIPQIDDNSLEHSNSISFDILSAIHKILTSGTNQLFCIGRKDIDYVAKKEISPCDISLPTYGEIEKLSLASKRNFILKILNIDNSFESCLNMFPDSWHIFVITIHYFLKKSSSGWPLIYSLIMCKLILSYIDKKVGFYRSTKVFNKKFGSFTNQKLELINANTIQVSLENISKNDSIECLKSLIGNFEMDYKLTTNYKAFDRCLVHSISQFQSCLLHVGYLNSLLEAPDLNFSVADLLNCTFVYNLTNNLNKRSNLDEYIGILLKRAPSILYSFNFIVTIIRNHIKFEVIETVVKKRRKKKKKTAQLEEEFDKIKLGSDDEVLYDPNNKFAILGVS